MFLQRAAVAAIVSLSSLVTAQAQEAKQANIDPNAFRAFSQADVIFTAKVKTLKRGPSTFSLPPTHTSILFFENAERIRGVKPDEKLEFRHRIQQEAQPEYPMDKVVLVAATRTPDLPGALLISYLTPATADYIAGAKLAASLPLGWSMNGSKAVSPWEELGEKAWPKDAPRGTGLICSKTGRPALLVPEGIEVKSEQVKPAVEVKFANTYGDGEFKFTVTNTTKKDIEVPALLTDGKEIRWADSLVVIAEGKRILTLQGAGKATTLKSVTLKANESVSTVFNALSWKEVEYPKGGRRVYFQFCLGDQSTHNFFYYLSRHHDPLREAALKKLEGGK